MALVIAPDDGYDSLVSLADAQGYMARMGYDWPADEAKQEIALRRGSQYITAFYNIDAKHLDPIDGNIKWAACEAALRAANGSLFTDVDAQAVTEESVGPITTKYAAPQHGGQKRFGVIDALMRGLYGGVVGRVHLVRG